MSIAGSSSCSDGEESGKEESKEEGEDSWARYRREDKGVERNIVRVKDPRVLKKYVMRRFPLMLKNREELFMQKSGKYEI
jgi:hypothetical protein